MNEFRIFLINIFSIFLVIFFGLVLYLTLYNNDLPEYEKYYTRNDIQMNDFFNKNLCLKRFNDYKVMVVSGISMMPTFSPGNILICDESIKEYKEGMIISFNYNNESVVHRIKAVYDNRLIMQGDNNFGEEKIKYEDIDCVIIAACY